MSNGLRSICMDADASPICLKGETGDRGGREADAAPIEAAGHYVTRVALPVDAGGIL